MRGHLGRAETPQFLGHGLLLVDLDGWVESAAHYALNGPACGECDA
ncbi:hypothetical protein BSLA_03r0139 [Burkholderia stabilis]|nr:hypothetical protein BSLA_03r0139 [Burkholderia stabilis]